MVKSEYILLGHKMMKAIIGLLLCILANVPSMADDACFYRKQVPIEFLAGKAKLTAEVMVFGPSCNEANIRIRVFEAWNKGEEIEVPWATYYDWYGRLGVVGKYEVKDDSGKVDKNLVPTFANSLLLSFVVRTQIPEYPKTKATEDPLCRITVSKSYYEKLANQKLNFFRHKSYEEGERYIAFVPELGQTIQVAVCGT